MEETRSINPHGAGLIAAYFSFFFHAFQCNDYLRKWIRVILMSLQNSCAGVPSFS